MKILAVVLLAASPFVQADDTTLDSAPLRECIASGGRPSIGTQGITCEFPDIQGHQVASSDPTGDPCPQQYEYGERELGFHLYCFGKK